MSDNNLSPLVSCSAGLDVHQKTVVATILYPDPENSEQILEITKTFSTFPAQLEELAKWLVSHNVEIAAMESTGVYWKSVYETLEQYEVKTQVVNARHAKQIPGRKTDVNDSKWLATLARYGLLKSSFIPSVDLRHLRLLTRHRLKIKSMIASEVNRIHKVLNEAGVRLGMIFSDMQSQSAIGVIEAIIAGESIDKIVTSLKGRAKKREGDLRLMLARSLSKDHKLMLGMLKKHIDYMKQDIKAIDEKIFAAMAPYKKEWEILQTIPGVDQVSAAVMIAEFGIDMTRFESSEKFCAWSGMTPGNNESAGKKKNAHTKKGAPTLRKILCEVANAATKTRSQFKGFYQGLVIRRGHKRSIIAVGHKILRVIFKLLDKLLPYKDPEIDYEQLRATKNAPRWIRTLEKFGYLTETPAA